MLKLITAEIYRLLHRKTFFIYLILLAVAYLLIAFIRSGGFDENSILEDALIFFNFLPPVVGGILFAAIYNDDLNAKNLITLVGYGTSRTSIVLSRLLLMTLVSSIVFTLAPLMLFLTHAALGWTATASNMSTIYALAFKYLLLTLGYATISGIVVYGTQRTTTAMVTFVLCSLNIIGGMLSALLASLLGSELASRISTHFMLGISNRAYYAISGDGSLLLPLAEFFIYLLIAVLVSIFAFRRKEMEF